VAAGPMSQSPLSLVWLSYVPDVSGSFRIGNRADAL